MGTVIKIVLMTILLVMVVFAGFSETDLFKNWLGYLGIGLYLRVASLLGLLIALLYAWGYREKIVSSQKYLRADEVLAQAQAKAVNKQKDIESAREKLDAEYAQKEKDLQIKIEKVKDEYKERINELKEKNIRLKESVAKLMQVVKKKN